MKLTVKNNKLWASVSLAVVALIIVGLSVIFLGQRTEETLYPSAALTEMKMLSDYYPDLKGSPVDTEVFIYRGEEEGSSFLLLGGTHPPEPSGIVGATLVMENIDVEKGTFYIIPRVNKSALSCTEPQDGMPKGVHIETENGTRFFRVGSRLTNPVHQWPDPDIYYHNAGQLLTGKETRNVDRTYPGNPEGNLTERLCYGIAELIRTQNIDVTLDMHEGPPEYPTIDVMITHQNAMDLAGLAALNMELDGVGINVDASPVNLHGFSHRELGDHTQTLAILSETVNPLQSRLCGKKNEELVITGRDKFCEYASANSDRLHTIYDETGKPLNLRVARNVELVQQLCNAYNELYPDQGGFEITGLPGYQDVLDNGMGAYLAAK